MERMDIDIGLQLLTRFEGLKNYNSLFVHKVIGLRGITGSFIILLVEKHVTIVEQRKKARQQSEVEEMEPIMIFQLPQDIGRAFIRKETMADKFADLFTKVDIDFPEYPNFSKNYYVMGEKPDRIKHYLPKRIIESLEKVEDLSIEINGDRGLLRTGKNLTEDDLSLLINVGHKMAE